MKEMKLTSHLLLTFDYELFLGPNSGTPQKCLIEPTRLLLEVLKKHRAKSIFFVDALYLLRLREKNLMLDFNLVAAQIRQIRAQGHDVFLHIHPHWIDAVYDPHAHQWNLSNISKYAFSALNEEELFGAFQQGYDILNEILGETSDITGFRAGGLFAQPFQRLNAVLKQLNIRYEFSVLPGFSSEAGGFSVHYPKKQSFLTYRFNSNILEPEDHGFFKEYTINQFSFSGYHRLVNSLLYRILIKKEAWQAFGNGKGAVHILKNNHLRKGPFEIVTESYSVELMNPWKIKRYEANLKEKRYLHMLSHPKLMSKGNLMCLDKFLKSVCSHSEVNFDFRNIPVPLNHPQGSVA